MNRLRKPILILGMALASWALCACQPSLAVTIRHTPIIATSSENVTFTATVASPGTPPATVDIFVNAALVQTCANLSSGATCTYTSASPYTAYLNTTVSYQARITDSKGRSVSGSTYYFAITDSNYNWSQPVIPARTIDAHDKKIDLIFHRAGDYSAVGPFVDDVEFKIWNVYGAQAIISDRWNLDKFNFYIYDTAGAAANCGTPNAGITTDAPWFDVNAVLHVANLQDCSSGSHFSAEGSNTKAFLHESGHAVFGLADEYDAGPTCYTYYFESANEPNISDLETTCEAEQTAKGRDPAVCREFTTCQGGWWGIHLSTDVNVMVNGMVGDPWGIEGAERMRWSFNNPSFGSAEALEAKSVIIIPIRFLDGAWMQGGEPVILPCTPETPLFTGPATTPLIRILGEKGEAVYSYNLPIDPTYLLIESGRGPLDLTGVADGVPPRFRDLTFYLRLPYLAGAQRFEFVSAPPQKEGGEVRPDFTIDLSELMKAYEAGGGSREPAACRDQVFKPDMLK